MFFLFGCFYLHDCQIFHKISGDFTEGAPPVPIPNTVVKPFEVDGTLVARLWESRTSLDYFRPAGLLAGRAFLFKIEKA